MCGIAFYISMSNESKIVKFGKREEKGCQYNFPER